MERELLGGFIDFGDVCSFLRTEKRDEELAKFTEPQKTPEEIHKIISSVTRICWREMHRGTITDTALRSFLRPLLGLSSDRLPDSAYYEILNGIIGNLNEPIMQLISRLRENGVRVCLVSDITQEFWRFINYKWPHFRSHFYHCFLSYQMKITKSDGPEIFRRALLESGLIGMHAFFTDNLPENLQYAREAGIEHTFLYEPHSQEEFESFLQEHGFFPRDR